MSTGAVATAAWSSTKSQIRRAKRKHTPRCLHIGVMQREAHLREVILMKELSSSPDLLVLTRSIATHRADCHAIGLPVHCSAQGNLLSYQNRHKSKDTFKLHRSLHKHANMIKHAVEHIDPPPAPPACDGFATAVSCEAFEKYIMTANRSF